MSTDQKQFAKVEVEVLNAVLEYLSNRPYKEAAGLISAVQTAEIIEPEIEMKERVKQKK